MVFFVVVVVVLVFIFVIKCRSVNKVAVFKALAFRKKKQELSVCMTTRVDERRDLKEEAL